jgi:hypothetical protein
MWTGRDKARRLWRWAPRDGKATAAEAIGRVVQKYGCAADIREHRIATSWREIVGDAVASRAWPDGLDEGVLWFEV